jgi:uncharacterized membrane protein YecN with MAPEG domain
MRGWSILLGACGIAAAALLWRQFAGMIGPPGGADSIPARLGMALAWLLPAMAALWAMLLAQMAARFISGVVDPTAGHDGAFLRTNQRVISNTTEHMLVFVPALLALAAAVDGPHMPQVAALALVFAVARIAFWAGYVVAPVGRASGMAATILMTAAALGWAAAIWTGLLPVG